MRYNNCVQQKPDPSVAIQGNPGFHDFVWPSRARLSLFTAQLTQSVIPSSQGTAWCTTEVSGFGFHVGLDLLVVVESGGVSLGVCHAALGGGAAKLRRALDVVIRPAAVGAPYRLAGWVSGGERSRAGLSRAAGEGW